MTAFHNGMMVNGDKLNTNSLINQSMIQLDTFYFAILEKCHHLNKITFLKKLELTSNEAVKQALLAGLGYSIMPLIGIRNEYQRKELQIIPVKGLPITTTWSLIWLKGKKLSPVATAYLDYLKKNKERIVHEKYSWYEAY